MGKQVKDDLGFVPDDQEIIKPPDDFGFVPDPVKKKESVSPSSSASTGPGQPQKKSTEKSIGFIESLKMAWEDVKKASTEPSNPQDKAPAPFINSIKRGLNLAEQASLIGPFSEKPDAKKLQRVSELQKESENLPGSESYTKFGQSKTVGEALTHFASDPVKILAQITGESMSAMAKYGWPRIAAGTVIGGATGSIIPGPGTVAGASGGAVVGMADTSLGLEYTGALLESLKEAGVNVTDANSLKSAFENDAVISEARSHALKKGIPIAIFDLISGGIAGKIVSKPAKSLVTKIGKGAVEFAVQGLMGAGGELTGEVVSGEKIQPAAILSEALGELGTTPVEVGLGLARIKPPAQVVKEEQSKLDTSNPASIDAAGAKIEDALNQNQNAIRVKSPDEVHVQPESADSEAVDAGTTTGLQETSGESQDQSETQKIIDQQEDETPEQQAERELQQLADSGGISKDGNKITILTEEGGKEAKRIYEQLKESKSGKDSGDNSPQEQQINSGDAGSGEGISETGPATTGVEQQRSESETTDAGQQPISEDGSSGSDNQIANAPQQNPTPEQQEQQPPNLVERPAEPRNEIPTTDQEIGNQDTGQTGSTAKEKTYAIAKRIFNSDASEDIKRGVKQKGSEYVPKSINITDKEATDLLQLYGHERTETLVRDQGNGITGDTRTALAARLYESYKQTADQASDPETKRINYDKAVDIALVSAEQLKEAGRQTNAAKIWKAITSNEDMTVLAIEKETKRQGKFFLTPIYNQVKRSRQQFDAQVEQLISQRVQEGVESRLKRAKLITQEKKQQISDAFDRLKIKDVSGTANDITRVLGSAIWNGSIEAVKHAVLTGADLANAVQAGVDYVKNNFKGDWDEKQYRDTVSPSVKDMIPESIDASQIDEQQIKTPKLSDKKKKDFLNQVVDAYNAGKLTDEKFEDLYAKQLGAKELTSEDRQQIRNLAKIISEVEKFETEVKDNFTRENIAKYKDLLIKAQHANTDLQQYAQKPSNVWDTLISIMQGNLLTPLSLVTNIYSNAALQPLRFLSSGFGSVIDYSVSQLAKTGLINSLYKDKTIDLLELQKGYFSGGWDGLIEGGKQIVSGPKADERNLREINNQFSPVRAISRWADGNRPLNQKINDYIEGTFGIPAEVMFRLLNAGDKPFRRAAETARAMEIGSQKGLKGKELEKFIMFPDADSQEQIHKAGNEATFQQESPSAKFVQEMLSKLITAIGKVPIIGGPLKVIAKSQIPYVKTPWNIMVETLQYAAFPVTGAIGIRQITKGDKRGGSVMLGKAIVGAIIFAVAKELFKKGLLSWDEPYDQKAGKQRERRQMQFDNVPPNALNVSAIQRMLLGEDIATPKGTKDTWIDYTKLGIMGMLFDSYSNNYFSNIKEKGQMPEESEFWVDMLTTAPRMVSQSLDQSFLKGTNTLLTAIQDGGGYETEQWLINTSGALSAIIYPNTLATVSKSSDEFIRDTRDDKFVEKLKNTYKTKFFIGEQLPAKVNLWGEKITGQPEGRDKYAYYLFDPTKFKNVSTDNFKYRLYQSWKDDKFNDDWLPSIPKRDITYRKVKIKLTPAMYEKYATYVGEQRKNLVSTYINSAGFERKDKEKVVKKLRDLYEEGAERGKKKFLMDTGWNIMTPTKLSQIGKTD